MSHTIPRNDNKGDRMYLLLWQKNSRLEKSFSGKGLGGRFDMLLNHFATSGDWYRTPHANSSWESHLHSLDRQFH